MIATTNFWTSLRYDFCFWIAISRTIPDWYKPDCRLVWLAPTWDMLNHYKQTKDTNEYTRKYLNILVEKDKTLEYLAERLRIKERKQNVLITCWEPKGEFCHRHLLADYLNVRFKMNIVEL